MANPAEQFQQNADAEPAPDASKKTWVDSLNAKFDLAVPGNHIRLFSSDKDHAFIIRFDKSPNEGLPKGEKHPVVYFIREFREGERQFHRDGDSPGNWMKSKVDNQYGQHIRWPRKDGEDFSRYNTAQKERIVAFIRDRLAPAMGGAIEEGVSR